MKRVEPISIDEERLWNMGLLGDGSSQILMDTMVFLCGIYFALRSGKEHRSLTIEQLEIVEETGRCAYVVYTENVAKNNTGGFAQRKLAAKQVVHHANLFCPPEAPKAFYLTPLKTTRSSVWYTK